MTDISIPSEWHKTTLGAVAQWGSGGTPSRKNPEYYGGNVPWVKTGDLGPKVLSAASEYITELGVKNSSAKYFPNGSVAIAMYGATIGKTSILGFDATTNQACAVGQPIDGITDTTFLYYLLRNEKDGFIAKGKGGAQPNISQALIKEHGIALPPLAEQKVIADKLDTLLAQVENTKARLERIPQILKRFRQSVLAAAVSGRLIDSPSAAEQRIGDLGEVIGGLTKNAKRAELPIKKPFLRVANVYANELRLDEVHEIGIKEKEIAKAIIQTGDLLIVEGNGSIDHIGRVALWQGEIKDCVHQNHLIKVRIDSSQLLPKFALYFLMSPLGKERIVEKATSGAGLYTLSISKVSAIEVPVFTTDEQAEIVRQVEQLFAHADRIEQQVNNALARVNNLTQSILAKAFRGDLSQQWRKDNPQLISGENSAEALLERIKAERAAMKPVKKTRSKRTTV
jgi:type I restriction enzyme S subunit